MFYFSAGLLVFSGIAGLIYQVTWVRLIGLSLGSTSASISTVLAAFFLGLALGSFLAERFARRWVNSLGPYALLEAVIGLSGLVLLPVLLHLDSVMALFPAAGSELWLKFIVAAALLIIPTTAMGATFPVMAAVLVRREHNAGARISQLYGFNTFGAVLGAGLSGFVIIPAWGLDGAIYTAASLNGFVVILASLVSLVGSRQKLETPQSAAPEQRLGTAVETGDLRRQSAVTLIFTGFVSVAVQVGWTKYLAIFTGSTIYGLSALLTVFLAGLAFGSWAIGTFVDRIARPRRFMAFGLLVLGATLVLARAGLSLLPDIQTVLNTMGSGGTSDQLIRIGILLALIFPPTFMFGMLFPLNLKLYCGDAAGVRRRVGEAYSLNTLAGIAGAVATGFWLIPAYGTDNVLTYSGYAIILLPLIWGGEYKRLASRLALPALVVVALGGNQFLSHLDFRALVASVGYDNSSRAGKSADFLFLKEGKAGVISLVSYDGKTAKLQNNGLNESQISLGQSKSLLTTEALLGLVPYLMRPDAQSAFVLGYGGGNTTTALTLTDLKSIHVVELEPAVVEAVQSVASGPATALADPRVSLEFNDARNTLLVQPTKYDLIVSQPSHPWLSGSANVFTEDFWKIAKSRLNDGGVFSQWINMFHMDATTLRSLLSAFFNVFPDGFVLNNGNANDLILIGSDQPLQFDYHRINDILARPQIRDVLRANGILTVQDVLWYFGMSRDEALAAAGGEVANSDTNILSEVRLSALNGNGSGAENPYTLVAKNSAFDVTPYVGKSADRLASLSQYFLSWKRYNQVELVDAQLATIDPLRGAVAEHNRLIATDDVASAIRLFETRTDWPTDTRIKQANALMDVGLFDDAGAVVAEIADSVPKRTADARLAYLKGDWSSLQQHSLSVGEERVWYLLGLAAVDIQAAGPQLAVASLPATAQIPALRALLRFETLTGPGNRIDETSARLAAAISSAVDQYATLAKTAAAVGDLRVASSVRDMLQLLAPSSTDLAGLDDRIASLREAAS